MNFILERGNLNFMNETKPVKQKILIVDDSEINRSILINILENEYEIIEAENGIEAVDILKKSLETISLVLLDIVMPEMDGFEVLSLMNNYGWIKEVPVIMISAENTNEFVERAYNFGVTDYINRPFDSFIVKRRVVNTVVLYAKQKKLIELVAEQIYEKEKNNNLMIDILSHIVEFRNGESGAHVLHIHSMSEILLKKLIQKTDKYNLTADDISLISVASSLHDIGKISIPESILNKPGKLTKEEFEIMKTHSMVGASMIEEVIFYKGEPLVKMAYEICRWHHERWDGRGYPDGLKGEEIPISAQIVSIADVYDALTSERVYKKAFTHETAMEMILNGECGSFNPLLLECLKEVADVIKMEIGAVKKPEIETPKSQMEMFNIAEHMLDKKDLFSNENRLKIIEYERDKNDFFASISDDIQFEIVSDPSMLTLSKRGVEKFGLNKLIMNPEKNEKIIEILGVENISEIKRMLYSTTVEEPIIRFEINIMFCGEPKKVRFVCKTLWTFDEFPKYTGAIGKVII